MDFATTETQRMIRETAAGIADRYGPRYWREKEADGEFPEAFYRELGEAGLLGMFLPPGYGGEGLTLLDTCIAIETLAEGGVGPPASWFMVLTPIFGGLPIARYGTDEQKETYLPGICDGETVFSLGVTEPDAGTNTLALSTRAERDSAEGTSADSRDTEASRDGDEYVIDGRKTWITNADRSDAMALLARTTPIDEVDRRTDGLTLFVVDLPADGVETSPIPKLGFNYTNSCDVFVDGLRVGEDAVIGEVDEGWGHVADVITTERVAHTAGAVGSGDLAIGTAVEYANDRDVFGEPIGSYQGLQFPLAALKSRLEAARALNHEAAWRYDAGEPYAAAANMAKFCGVDAAFEAADRAMQTHGGVGYAREYDVERWWRELRLLRIAPVTQEMALNYVGQHVLGMPRSY